MSLVNVPSNSSRWCLWFQFSNDTRYKKLHLKLAFFLDKTGIYRAVMMLRALPVDEVKRNLSEVFHQKLFVKRDMQTLVDAKLDTVVFLGGNISFKLKKEMSLEFMETFTFRSDETNFIKSNQTVQIQAAC